MEGTIYLKQNNNSKDEQPLKEEIPEHHIEPKLVEKPEELPEPEPTPEYKPAYLETDTDLKKNLPIEKPTITTNSELLEKDDILNNLTQKYIENYKTAVEKENTKVSSPIYVDELASKLAKFYEKARRVIDWKEEHLVRRTAIERVLKRRLISEVSGIYFLANTDPEEMAEPIVMELIRSGYFGNGKISRNKIEDVKVLLEKYIGILQNNPMSKENLALNIKRKVEIYNWVIETAACEIEEILDPPYRQQALLDYMTEILYKRISVMPDDRISDQDKKIQILISVQRTLFDLDDAFISYYVLKLRHPEIFGVNTPNVTEFAQNLLNVWDELKLDMDHKYAPEFYKIAEKYDAVYRVIGDVMENIKESPEEITTKIKDKNSLGSLVKNAYDSRVKTLKKRLFRSAIYSTLSILLAGAVSLYIVEVPLAKMVYGTFSPLALFVDLAIPSAFMFLLVILIKPPSKDNFGKLSIEIEKALYKEGSDDTYEIRLEKKKRVILNIIFVLLYLILGFSSLYLVFWIFQLANVPWTSLYIDTLNVAIVVFAAVVIKQRSKEITLEDGGNLWSFLVDMISLPLAKIGAWLSNKWKEYNFVSVFFTTLVDTPFATLIATIEDWRTFIKEKRSEIH